MLRQGIRQLGQFLQSYVALVAYVFCCSALLLYIENNGINDKRKDFMKEMELSRQQIDVLRRDTESRLKVFINVSVFDRIINDARNISMPKEPDFLSFKDSVFFVWSLVTTVGRDNLEAPSTFYGQLIILFTSITGIPLFGIAVYKLSNLLIFMALDMLTVIERGCLRRKMIVRGKAKLITIISTSMLMITIITVYKIALTPSMSLFEAIFEVFLHWSTIGVIGNESTGNSTVQKYGMVDHLILSLTIYVVLAHLMSIPRICMLASDKQRKTHAINPHVGMNGKPNKNRLNSKHIYHVANAEQRSPHVCRSLNDGNGTLIH